MSGKTLKTDKFFVSLHVYRPKVKDTTDIIQIKSKYAEVFRQVIRLF